MTLNPTGLCLCGCGEQTALAKQTQARKGIQKGQPQRFVHGHNGRVKNAQTRQRSRDAQLFGFTAFDEAPGPLHTPCWIYRKRPTQRGYAQFRLPDGRQVTAHRAFYECHIGPIPEGLTLDHLCRTPRCVNPAHMEPVTRGENVLRGDTLPAANAAKTRCPRGHAYDEANTRITPQGTRACRTCARERRRNERASA